MEGQWDYYYYKGMSEVPPAERDNGRLAAAGTACVIQNALALIQDGELIVGHNYGLVEGPFREEGAVEAALRQSLFTPEQIADCLRWRKESAAWFDRLPEAVPETEQDRALAHELAAMGYMISANHTVLGYEKVLRLGFEGLLQEVERCAAAHGEGSDKEAAFYEGLRTLCRAGCELGEKYAKKAAELLVSAENTPARKAELERIVETCRRVPRRPARSFIEAVQSLWFAHIINTWEDGINANSLGRLDQILYPYYQADLAKGALTREQAFEILCCLWIKLYRDYDVQQSCVGGCGPDGRPAVNELSYLMLDATEALDFVRCLSVRYSAHSDRAFLRRALEVVGHLQKGVPFFFNDDVMIPALEAYGIDPADALDYTQIGCVETVIPGRANPHAVTARVNLLKALEYALNDGHSMLEPELCPGLPTGGLATLHSYEKLKEAVWRQIRHLIDSACRMTVRAWPVAAQNDPKPYKSLLTEGCVERGLDFNNRGAKYDYYQMMFVGLPNLADSLAALRELVFGQKRYTLAEIVAQLKQNFPDEAIRLDLVNKAPKFGNDIDEVDDIAREVLDFACDYLAQMSQRYPCSFHPQPFTFLWMVPHGEHSAASPDGRRNGEILAYSVSPMQGRDFNGFTALVNSLAKLPTRKTPGTTSAIVEADPQLFTDKNIPRFVDILLAGAEQGGSNLQFNVVDADTLLDAQKNPDKHRNLAVRVSGFSQKFYLLDKQIQDHIINRTKHKYI